MIIRVIYLPLWGRGTALAVDEVPSSNITKTAITKTYFKDGT